MPDFFIDFTTFAAPFFSEQGTAYRTASTPEAALEDFIRGRDFPIYAANAYETADAYHRGQAALARWRSNKARFMEERRAAGACSFYSDRMDRMEVDGVWHDIPDPMEGTVVA